MQQFKVITLSIGGHSNKIFHSQDIVTTKDFPSEENVFQHVLTGGLHPLNEDGSEMELVIITQEMIDEMPEEQIQDLAKAGIGIKPGMRTYIANGGAKVENGISDESQKAFESETDGAEEQIGEATDEPRTEVPNDEPLVEEPKETPAPKAASKKSNAKK